MDTVLVAGCLAGWPCRYHGRATPTRSRLLSRLRARYRILYICPELLGGLPVPRPPTCPQGDRLIAAGQDVTAKFANGARRAVGIALEAEAVKFYGVKGSPSCDPRCGVTCQMLERHGVKCHIG